MTVADFPYRYERYLEEARAAQLQDLHHDQRRELFLNFLGKAFDIDLSQVEREQYIQLRGQQVKMAGTARIRKGWIDAIFRDLIFEFKRDLKRELADGLRELKDYLSNIPDGDRCVGLLTDGLKFTAYVLDDTEPNGLREVDALDLERTSAPAAQSWLDAYLLRQRSALPTSADIVSRFGLRSPTFAAAAHILRDALAVFSKTEAGAAEVKRQQWAFYLARVYGSADASNDEMFVRHTYLCQFAKILAYAVYFSAGDATSKIEDILSGQGFEVLGISNIGEEDFFAWVLAPEVKERTLAAFGQIAASLAVYDLSKINEDLLKQLYQNLVEPETRHELGEFYTPDWLAELTLREINYSPGKSLLDPACGSGTFLFTALRLLAEQGTTGEALVDFALENVMGIDVHPLAVTIARINYMLAIVPHLRQARQRGQRPVPVFMANSLQRVSKAGPVGVIAVPLDNKQRIFQIPEDAASRPRELLQVLEEMRRRAQSEAGNWPNISTGRFGQYAAERLLEKSHWNEQAYIQSAWDTNLKYLAEQIAKGRDTIWVYVLRNTSQPQILQRRKFDVIAGNPPWIAYRYLKDPSYREDVKELTRAYGLLESGDVKLNTQMELSTLFFEHSSRMYLKPGGTIAFVMPRSVMTGAKQHRAFQRKGFSQVLDLKGVAPLFNVETCVMIRQPGDLLTSALPSKQYNGRLPAHECRWSEAGKLLKESDGTIDFAAESEIASPYYYPRFKQGATLVPRNLVFVTSAQPGLQPGELAHTSIMKTDPDVDAEAKAPWKGLSLQGHIDDAFLYATLLSKNLVPFGIRRLHLVALPVRVGYPQQLGDASGVGPEKRFIPMSLAEMRDSITFARSADDWFARADDLWEKHRKSLDMSLWDRLNFQQGVVGQSAEPGYLVMYGATGSNISCCIMDTRQLSMINGVSPNEFVVDHKAYWCRCDGEVEAHYLAAILNAPCVDAAIKAYQTRGIYVGPRDIHRRPFEVCPIPEYDASNTDHQRLAELSQAAHVAVAALDLREGGVVAARKKAREAARSHLDEIDAIARRMLGLADVMPVTASGAESEEEDEEAEIG